MMERNFEDYGFKPSAVITGLNAWYEHGGFGFFCIELPDSKEEDMRFHVFRTDTEAAIDAAIKYLRSFDIFYAPGMKWDDVKFKLNTEACNAEYGFSDIHDAWPKVNTASDQRKVRDSEIRDYILKRVDMNDIKIPESFRDPEASVEDLIAYLFALLMQERKDKKLDAICINPKTAAILSGADFDGDTVLVLPRYLEMIDRLQKKLDGWNCWYNDKERY